jgi:hypothetical protein
MKLSSLMTRAVAAGAVVGVALIGPAVAAGASSLPVSLPVAIGHVVSGPVVNLGPSPSSPVGSGADATVPAHGDASAEAPGAAPVPSVGKSSASADACVAAALLTGHDVGDCGSAGGSHDATSAPSLADALSRVGSCAQLALEQGQSTDVCADSGSGGAVGSGLDSGSGTGSGSASGSVSGLASGSTSGSVSGSASVPGASPDVAPFNSDAVGQVIADSGLCDAVAPLGLGFDACSITSAAAGHRSRGIRPGAGDGSASGNTVDICRGMAVVTGLDPATCTVKADAKPAGPSAEARAHATGRSESGSAISAPAQLHANCASSIARVGNPSPLRNTATAGLGTLGALGGLGMALRHLRRPRLG